jgi:hypothetical protein
VLQLTIRPSRPSSFTGTASVAMLRQIAAKRSSSMAPSSIGMPLTHRHYSQGVVFITGHGKTATHNPAQATLAKLDLTLVIYMRISGPQIRELTRNHRLKRIEEVTDVLYFRYILKKKRVRKGLSLVTNALNDTDDKYFLTSSEKTELAAHREIKRQALQEAEIVKLASDNRRSALDRFKDWWPALPDHKQLEIWGLFLKYAISLAVIRSKRLAVPTVDLTHPSVSSTFLAFVARGGLIPE